MAEGEHDSITYSALVLEGEKALRATSPSSRLDSELLLMHAQCWTRAILLAELSSICPSGVRDEFHRLIARRAAGSPVAYLTGTREFWSMVFDVTPDVLIPRPETELLVEFIADYYRRKTGAIAWPATAEPIRFVDLGTGSGCIAISLVRELASLGLRSHCIAVDQSPRAISVAQRNAQKHGVSDLVSFVESDWFSDTESFSPPYEFIVANPPYVSRDEPTSPEVAFEPDAALFAADNGLQEVRRIIAQSRTMLSPDGFLLIEIGAGKRRFVEALAAENAESCSIRVLGDEGPDDSFSFLEIRYRSN